MMFVIKIFKALRLTEVLLMSGFIIIGSIFSIENNPDDKWVNLTLVSIISYLLMLSVYTANSFLGYNADKNNERLDSLKFVGKSFYIITTIIFYFTSFMMCLVIKPESLLLHFIIFLLWFLYAMPRFGKHLPVVGTVLHFLVTIVQFNFAYMFFYPISEVSISISIFFALLISAGHLHHEIIDFEVDKLNMIKTSTVKWGISKTKYFSFLIFLIAHLYWIFLFKMGMIDKLQMFVFCSGFLIHFVLFIYFRNSIETKISKRLNYRFLYRLIYLICGLVITSKVLFL